MTGFERSSSIHPHPGCTAHALNPPIFQTGHNHTFRTSAKFTGQVTRDDKHTSQVLLYKHSHVFHSQPPKYFPGCKVNIKQQLPLQERTSFSEPSQEKPEWSL